MNYEDRDCVLGLAVLAVSIGVAIYICRQKNQPKINLRYDNSENHSIEGYGHGGGHGGGHPSIHGGYGGGRGWNVHPWHNRGYRSGYPWYSSDYDVISGWPPYIYGGGYVYNDIGPRCQTVNEADDCDPLRPVKVGRDTQGTGVKDFWQCCKKY